MGSAQVQGDRLLVDGAPWYIHGGEVHYFRLPRAVWRDRLRLAREGGMNTISSYIPWYWHEPEEGVVDLTGATMPERDLRAFLDLAVDTGLKVIARPGPFINSELRWGGFPEWLFRDHPDTMSRRGDGRIATGRPLPAEGEPLYRTYVRGWYRAVNAVLAEYDIHRGGPIILYQPDNELSAAWSYGLLNSLYDPVTLAERWPAWLHAAYGEIAALNGRYGVAYTDFTEVEAPREFPADPGAKRRCLDWLDFKRDFFAEYGATLARWAIEDGMLVPMTFNEPVAGFYGHGDHPRFGRHLRDAGIQGFTSCHTYADRVIDVEGAVGTAMGVELVKAGPWSGPPVAVEVNTKWYIPRLSRSDLAWEPLMRLGLGHGLMGSVIYPYTTGIAPLADTIEGPEYYEPSAIDGQGIPREGYRQLQRFHRCVAAWHAVIADARMVADLTIAISPAQRYLDFLGTPPLLHEAAAAVPGGTAFDAEPSLDKGTAGPSHDWLDGYENVSKQTVPAEAGVWKKVREACLLCTRLNVSYDLLDLTVPNRAPGGGWVVVPNTGSLERAAITWLLDHLDAGGGCLFFPTVPVLDEDGNPDPRLAERLGVRLTAQIAPAGGAVLDYGARPAATIVGEVGIPGWLFLHDVPAGSTTLATFDGRPLVARLPESRGRAVLAGADLLYTSYAGLRLWREVLTTALGIVPAVRDSGRYHHGLLLRGAASSLLVAINLDGQGGEGMLHVDHPVDGIAALDIPVDLRPHEARCLILGAGIAGTRLLYATSEVTPDADNPFRVSLYGHYGTTGELAFATPIQAILDGQPVATEPHGDLHLLRYRHTGELMELEIR
jgi:hypothetical protein